MPGRQTHQTGTGVAAFCRLLPLFAAYCRFHDQHKKAKK